MPSDARAVLEVPAKALADLCRKRRIRKLALFGSVPRTDFGTESDVDVFVEFAPGATVGFFSVARIEDELSRLFGGRKVGLRTAKDLSPYLRDEVLASSLVRYGGP
ncbi:MAG: nucleotidyltransferase family protein [Planctomycetes bacterium]|nr:nucleotidyltransferase family protein [Planctomycetota bacterium]